LKDAPADLRVEVRLARVRSTQSALLRDCRDAPERLLMDGDPKREPRSFMLALSKPMGKKGGRMEGSFIAETKRQTTEFYRDLVQGLMPPQTKAPKIRDEEQKTIESDEAPAAAFDPDGKARREYQSSFQPPAEPSPFSPR
jgi:hypothetical protein